MNAEELFRHYERVADAPEAVTRLRRFVLDLAVRGKLVDQCPTDEPASELLGRIASEKAQLCAAGLIRPQKPAPPLEEEPFRLPDNWRWTQLVQIGLISPRNDAPDETLVSFVPMTLVAAEYGGKHGHEIRPWGEIKKGYTHFANEDVGLAKITPCFENGKSTVFRGLSSGIGSGTTELHVVRPVLVSPDFIVLVFKSPYFIETGIPRMTGTAGQKRVPAEYFANSPFPLPPLAEQHRIVAKVDELMALCDRLEAARAEREAVRDRLTAASLARLNTPDSETFADDARFALDAITAFTTRHEQVQALRQTILNLAAAGMLVPHEDTDEPVAALLARLSSQRASMVDSGALPRPKVARRDLSRLAGDLPNHWAVAALGDLCTLITSGSRGWAEYYADTGPAFVRAQNVRFGRLLLDGLARVNPPNKSEGSRTQVAKGDLLVVITGAGVTNPGLLDRDIGEAYVSQHVALVRPTDSELSPWLLLCLMAPSGGRAELVDRAYGSGKPGLNLDNLRSLSVPIPPIAEQRRIVAKVAELMHVCDQLEASLSACATRRARLLEALLRRTLEPTDLEWSASAAEAQTS
jgi:type I restriction enzyme S subunit